VRYKGFLSKHWTVLASRIIFEGHPHRLRLDTCRTPDGVAVTDYFVREVNDVAMVFALTPDERVVLVRQYRHAAGVETLELPQGLLDAGEEFMAAGARELLEETGYAAPRLTKLTDFLSNPAVQTNRVHLLLGLDAADTGTRSPDPEEDLDVLLHPLADIDLLIESGEIRSGSSVAGILFALRHLARSRP